MFNKNKTVLMIIQISILLILGNAIAFSANMAGGEPHGNHGNSSLQQTGHGGEHERDNHEHDGSGEGSEESGDELGLHEVYNKVRKGVRLELAYDAKARAFVGTLENTTGKTLKKVRVEVHLSNGLEIGPTKPVNLKPGQKHPVRLLASEKPFERWNTHAEVGSGEHSGSKHGHEGRNHRHEGGGHGHEGGDQQHEDQG